MKASFALFGIGFFLLSNAAFAMPAPNDVWGCLKQSDPAIESDGDGFLGANPVLCHLDEYTVSEIAHGLKIDAKFNCLMDDGKRKELPASIECATPVEPTK